MSRDLTLRKLTVRQYLARARILCVAIAMDDEAPTVINDPASNADFIAFTRALMANPEFVFVSHNWAFDGRVLQKLTGLYPVRARCSMEAAMCAWPNMPGGYRLENLAKVLRLPSGEKAGHALDVMKMTPEQLDTYVSQDTRLCRDVYKLCLDRVPEHEWAIGELCNRVREGTLLVDGKAVDAAVEALILQADVAATTAAQLLEDMDWTAFGSDEAGHVKSVKPHVVKDLLLRTLGFSTHSISAKKVDPVALTANDSAKQVLDATGKANKALSHRRRIQVFQGVPEVDMELGWFRAHTGRFSSPSSGRGLNLHNLPKHDKDVAKLIRSMYRLPDDLCLVRSDEANVEYRVEGLLSGSIHVKNLFTANVLADPYATFGQACTGKPIKRTDPQRQLFKAAVLGLGFTMGLELWTKELLKALAKPKAEFTLTDLRQTCEDNNWQFPPGGHAKRILRKTGCDPAVVTTAYHTRRLFHDIHPEFFQLASWLHTVCAEVSAGASQSWVDDMYAHPGAPLRELLGLVCSDRFEGRSIEATCGYWPSRTVVWRDLGVRDIPQRGVVLSVMSGIKGYRALTPATCIENVTQSAARNATCTAKLHLADRYPYLLSVHDEISPVVPATPGDVWAARDALIETLGPDGYVARQGWGWSVVVNPAEINVSRSLFEVDVAKLDPRFPTAEAWWGALGQFPELLRNLP